MGLSAIAVALCIASLACSASHSDRILIPNGFRGRVFIVFDDMNGSKPEHAEKSLVFRVPDDGVLFTQVPSSSSRGSMFDVELFFVSDAGEPVPIAWYNPESEATIDSQAVSAYDLSVGGASIEEGRRVEFLSFVVGQRGTGQQYPLYREFERVRSAWREGRPRSGN